MLYWEWKNYDIATVIYRNSVTQYPKNKRFKEDLATILVETSQFVEARDLYRELYEAEKNARGTVSWYVGSGYAEAAGKANSQSSELNNALNAGLVAISKKTDESFSYHALAVVYKKMKNMDKAIEYIQKAGGLEGNRETSMHTYDRKRHLLYRRLLQKWMMD